VDQGVTGSSLDRKGEFSLERNQDTTGSTIAANIKMGSTVLSSFRKTEERMGPRMTTDVFFKYLLTSGFPGKVQ